MHIFLKLFVPLLLVLGIASPSYSWFIYYKPAFKGKVIDADTKEPIEGAVIVAVYDKRAIRLAPHSVGIIMHAQETLTAKDGTFVIPSYTTITDPFSFDFRVTFVIYKSGYGSFPAKPGIQWVTKFQRVPAGISPDDHENFFSRSIGSEGELELAIWEKGVLEFRKVRVPFGIVELPKLKTREERLKVIPAPPGEYSDRDLPMFYKAINEERKSFGLQEVR